MRTVLFSWMFGFVALVSLAGCGALQRSRERTATASEPHTAPATVTYESYKAATADAVDRASVPWPKAPAMAAAVEQAPPTPPRTIALKTEVKIENSEIAVVQETAKKIEINVESAPTPVVTTKVVEKIEVKEPNATNSFRNIVGQVQEFRKTWRLRYASLEQDDPFGGSVMLEGSGLDGLHDGQQVRVQGELIPPTDRNTPARYRVQSLEILN